MRYERACLPLALMATELVENDDKKNGGIASLVHINEEIGQLFKDVRGGNVLATWWPSLKK